MGIKCVLISSAGIIICWKLTESLLCSSDQTPNWRRTAESLPPVSAWLTAKRRVFHSSASFALCAVKSERFKGQGAQISAGHASRSMWCCMWQYTCHLGSAEKGQVCDVHLHPHRDSSKGWSGWGTHVWAFKGGSDQQARDKWLYSLTRTHSALLVGVYSCTLEQKKMKKVTSPFLFLKSLKAVQRGAAFVPLKLVGTSWPLSSCNNYRCICCSTNLRVWFYYK